MLVVITFVCILLQILQLAIIARALVSWIPNLGPDNTFVRILDELTEPIISPLRQIVPRVGMIDITPLVALILLNVLQGVIGCRGGLLGF